jgi:ribosomal-protein-serine acetyltransferase
VSQPLFDLGDGAEVRVLDPPDADDVFRLVDAERDRLRPWLGWVDDTGSAADVRRFIEGCRASVTDLDGLGLFVRGDFRGGLGLMVRPMHREGEIGYWIGLAFEGRGLVTRASRALVTYGFGDMRLHRITIRAAPENARSRAIPERLGFVQEGVLREACRVGGGFTDLVVYGMLDREWAP